MVKIRFSQCFLLPLATRKLSFHPVVESKEERSLTERARHPVREEQSLRCREAIEAARVSWILLCVRV
jgi:hypothetical protein